MRCSGCGRGTVVAWLRAAAAALWGTTWLAAWLGLRLSFQLLNGPYVLWALAVIPPRPRPWASAMGGWLLAQCATWLLSFLLLELHLPPLPQPWACRAWT